MPTENNIKIHTLLSPVSFLYGLGVRFRNQLFDWGAFPKESYPIPVICIGNLAVGGTGKTPHTEYIIRLLRAIIGLPYSAGDINGKHPALSWRTSKAQVLILVMSLIR